MGENTTAAVKTPPPSSGGRGFFSKLYTGTGAFQIISRRRQFYIVTGVVVLVCILSIAIRGFTFGIDFEGGSRITFPTTPQATTSEVADVFEEAIGNEPVSVQTVGSGGSSSFLIQAETLSVPQSVELRQALFDAFQPVGADGTPTIDTIGVSAVSSTWGGEITKKAIFALVVFLVLVGVYIAIRFERDMAFAALLAVLLDLIVTAGIYSLVGFEVSPATVIGLLTILGYSLYDTVVVFDKVEENVEGLFHQRRRTYAEQANLAVNQTLMRSINTSLTTILPILALMVIAVWMLGVGTLKDLALVLLIGITVGTYSSICTATPLLVTFKEMHAKIKGHNKKVYERRARAEERAAAGHAAADDDDVADGEGDSADGDSGDVARDGANASGGGAAGGGRPRAGVSGTATKPRPGARPASKRRKRR
ncbi:protein translocase subunit SecF [Tomitella gaofuii]|uniref:protein translocase subunit SecF n=1 Tax=Tomitella gaofuii TaxID=2760083 RepID=UPI0015FCA05E|nr:protein translocase subunit SecF [Tomitella gaofuii]